MNALRHRIINVGLALIMALSLIGVGGVSQTAQAAGSVSLTTFGATYTEDFNTLASTGTSSIVPNGWEFFESGVNANATYTAGTGSATAGDTYSFGAAADTERALGGCGAAV